MTESTHTNPAALTIQGVAPTRVIAPASEAEAAAAIAQAASSREAIVPIGGGTAQGLGNPPPKNFIALSTAKLNKLIQHEPGDMVATAQAGLHLGAFQDALAARGQWLPLDGDPHATIGGLVATDRYGPLAHGYGTLRDMVLGMSVINGDGVLRKCGGKVVKNVTGYSLDKLYIGSLGTLGLVTEVTFKLRPLPIGRSAWSLAAGDVATGIALLRKVAVKNLPLERLYLSCSLSEERACKLAVAAAGTEVELERIGRELEQVCVNDVCSTDAALSVSLSTHWNALDSRWVRARVPAQPPFGILRFWCMTAQLEAAWHLIEAHTASVAFNPDGGTAALNLSGGFAETLGPQLAALGVNFRFENLSGVRVAQPFGAPRPEWQLMQRIKQALDPQTIMNPGRFVV